MPDRRKRPLSVSFTEARERWLTEHTGQASLEAVVGCTNHHTLTCWQDPKTNRMVFTVESYSEWPDADESISSVVYVEETGPFGAEQIYKVAALTFRNVIEGRYGPLR